MGRRRPALDRGPGHLRRHRAVELDLRPRSAASTTGTASSTTSPTSTTTTPRWPTRCSTSSASGSTSASTGSASTRCRTCSSATAPTARTSPRPTSTCAASARSSTTSTPARCCSPRPTSGPRTSSTTSVDGDECHMCFHFPLMPRMFMAVRREQRHPITEILAQTPDDPRRLPVGDLPAQPRRADPRDGHRRGARLHVRRVRQGPAHAAQHRHRPPAVPAPRERPRTSSSCSTPCCSRCRAARSSTTATRSGWATTSTSATATACARRCSGRPTATAASRTADFAQLYLPPLMDPVYGFQAVNVEAAAARPVVVPALAAPHAPGAPRAPGVRHRHLRGAPRRQPVGARLPPRRDDDRRHRAVRQQPQPVRRSRAS